jgi:predicted nucleic acid-binding protein
MYALDTNILVYTHNLKSAFHPKAKEFVERIVAEEDTAGKAVVGVPLQACSEFINVITRQTIDKPLSLPDAILVKGQNFSHCEALFAEAIS